MNKIIRTAAATAFLLLAISPLPGFAFDVNVTQGNASVSTKGNTVTITATGRAVLQGNTSIPAGTTVKVVQGINDILLRDTTGLRTDILGSLFSNGNIILINSMGVYIGQSAQVKVGGLIASTLDMKNQLFMNGNYQFQKIAGLNPAEILNEANITVPTGGYVILLGDRVVNKGTITAYMGTVALGSGQQATVSFDQGGLINLVIDKGLAQQLTDSNGNPLAQIVNSGAIHASGGKIQMTAKLLEESLEQIVNNTGNIEASNVVNHGGLVELTADGAIENSGTIKAGTLKEKGETFHSSSVLDVGHGYFDNLDGAINISGSISGLISDVADINLTGAVSLSADTTLQADSGNTGTQGKIVMNGNSLTGAGFNLTMTAGLDDTLDGSITGVNLLTLNSSTAVDRTFTSTGGSFSVDTLQTNYHSLFSRSQGAGTAISPYMIYSVSNAVGGLQYITTQGLGAFYQLANNIDAAETSSWNSGAGFTPIGSFTGTFNGKNFTISNLFINLPAVGGVGLFGGTSGATIENVGVLNVNITGGGLVGGIVGFDGNGSYIHNTYATGTVVTGSNYAGGLSGDNNGSTIDNSYAAATVSGPGNSIGGLVGESTTTSYITNSYATGNVIGGGSNIGGLVGRSHFNSNITNSYATGSVNGNGAVGGLVGYNNFNSSITNSFATGVATSTGDTPGGLIGSDDGSNTMINSWWYNATNGSGVGNWAPPGVSKATAVSDFYNTAQAVYNGANPWDFYFTWLSDGISNPTLGINPITDIWIGSGDWSVAGNWSRNLVPTIAIPVLFNDTSTNNSTVDAGFAGSVAALGIKSGYTGTITQSNPLTISNIYTQSGGIFDQNADLSVGSNFFQSGGVFASDHTKNFSVGNSFSLNGGTFNRFTGSGTSGSPYLIYDVYGLQAMEDYLSSTFDLANVIDATVTSSWNAGAGFVPIGNNNTSQFSGVFNGNDYTVSNLLIDLPSIGTVGLFGETNTATIKNIGLLNVNITGQAEVGGLVGQANSSSISNSYVTGTVNGSGNNTGGLMGQNSSSVISNSYESASVNGNSYVGGLVGINDGGGSDINDSYATGSVSGSGNYVGGLVGYNAFGGTIDNTYATGSVSGSHQVGGLVGYNLNSSIITNSFATGVAISSGDTPGGLIGNDDGTNTLTNNWWYNATNVGGVGNSSPAGITEAGAASDFYSTAQAVYNGAIPWDFNYDWIASGLTYPTLGVNPNTDIWSGSGNWSVAANWSRNLVPTNIISVLFNDSDVNNSTIDGSFAGLVANIKIDSGYTGTITQNANLAIAGNFFQKDGAFVSDHTKAFTVGNIFNLNGGTFNRFTGSGASGSPYLIYDVYGLQAMEDYLSSTFGLANVIDASATSSWNAGAGFAPIGISSPFTGTFNGNNFTISNLFINLPTTNDVGLLGQTNLAVINNVGLINANITGGNKIGCLVGYNNSSNIDNSFVSGGTISGVSGVGGLVGYNISSNIDNSYATSSVNGSSSYTGGLVGLNSSGSISQSYATGLVNGGGASGGLVGYSQRDTIDNSYATGNVSGTNKVGGLVGSSLIDSIANSYATGNVNGTTKVGGLVGSTNDQITSNSFATGVVTSSGDVPGGLIGDFSSGELSNNWWYNAVNGVGVGDASPAGVIKATAVSDFYNTAHAVYNGAEPWDFNFDWLANGVSYPTLGINPNTDIWTGSGNWSVAANWSRNLVPTNLISVLFNFSDINNSSIDASFAGLVANLKIDAGYTGTITQNANLTIGGNFTQKSGTFISDHTKTFNVGGNFNLFGGTFNRFTGSGTGGSPYLIYDVYGLQAMEDYFSDTFGLANNIDASATSSWNGGQGFSPVGSGPSNAFSGTLNGHNFTISNLFINMPISTDYAGLFGYTSHALISNVGIINPNVTGGNRVGALVGYNYNSSSIDNSYVTGGTVSGLANVGGLAGYNYSSNIDNSYATASVVSSGGRVGGLVGYGNHGIIDNSYASGTVSGGYDSGGLVGGTWSSTTSNSYATGNVISSGGAVGGLVGYSNSSSIDNSYATGSVSGTSEVGGLVGYNYNFSSVINSFATGVAVSTGDTPGGLIGNDDGTNTLFNNWWYNTTNGTGVGNSSPGGISLANAVSDFYLTGSGTGGAVYSTAPAWDFTTVWVPLSNTYPVFRFNYIFPPGPPPPPSSPSASGLLLPQPPPELTENGIYTEPDTTVECQSGGSQDQCITIKHDTRWDSMEAGRAVKEPLGIELLHE